MNISGVLVNVTVLPLKAARGFERRASVRRSRSKITRFIPARRLGQRPQDCYPPAVRQLCKLQGHIQRITACQKEALMKTSIICAVQDADNEHRRSAASGPMPPKLFELPAEYDERVLNLDPTKFDTLLSNYPGPLHAALSCCLPLMTRFVKVRHTAV